MRKVIIIKGLPASNKSGWAKEQVAKSNCAIKRVNKDDLRSMLDSSKHSKGNESYVLQLRDHIILTALNLGKSVIVDDTNFHPCHEERIRELVSDYNEGIYGNPQSVNVQVEVKFFDVSPEECIKRDLKRPNSVGAKVIWTMYNQYLKPETEKIEPMKQDSSLNHAIIIDLDGTLCIHNGRNPYEYDKCDTDLLNVTIANIINDFTSDQQPNNQLIFLSGREDSCREKTIKWLADKLGWTEKYINEHLFMRKTGDNRKDTIIKKEIFDSEIKDKYYIDYILDDRNCVVKMWREMGLICLQVADGDF